MRYTELFEKDIVGIKKVTTPSSFWINVNTKEILPSPDEHVSYIFSNPEQFDLDNETVQQIKDAYGSGWTMPLMELVSEKGWVRGGKDYQRDFKSSYFLQGWSNEHLWKAANILSEQVYFDQLSLDTFFESFSSQFFTKIYGDELEHWLKTGKFF